MKSIFVLQHSEREDLGAMEPYFRQFGVALQVQRPLVTGKVTTSGVNSDGLILLGGVWGTTGSERDERTTLPTLDQELRVAYDHMKRNRPIVAIGLGAQIACIAAGGGSEKSAAAFEVGEGRRVGAAATEDLLPQSFAYATFMRDRPVPPDDAEILAVDAEDRPLAFRIGRDVLCFTFHPGYGAAMLEKIIVEAKAVGAETAATLDRVAALEASLADSLGPIMAGISKATGWRQSEEIAAAAEG